LSVITNNEGKNDMITQAIKRWLDRVFAWWPWRRSPDTSYAQAVSNMNKGVTQESIVRHLGDGPLPQTGTASVAVEQGSAGGSPELSRPTNEERPEYVVSSHPTIADENANQLATTKETSKSKAEAPNPSPTPEQKLAFLQYLVKRGTINEGFNESQIPKQYKKCHS